MIHLFVTPTDNYQYLDSSSCHPYQCKKYIPYRQVLYLNRIYSNNAFFDQRCNELEQCEEKECEDQGENKLTFNITLSHIPKYQDNFERITDSTSAR